jgi:ubiquinone/menaquinone biosynthesis C-methylase UbiE
MTGSRRWAILLAGLAAVGLAAAWRVYSRRARERVASQEGLDDPAVARAFNRVAGMPQMRALRWFVVQRAVALRQEGQAADLGCGPGHLAIKLAQAAPALQVIGVDLSGEMLAQAGEHARRSGLEGRLSFRKGDAAQIPLPDGSLDLVVSTASLHHWRDPAGALDEIARVLRPGGSFLIFDLRRDMAAPFYLLLWFATRCVAPGALRRVNEPLGSRDAAYTVQEAERLAEQSRLTGWRVARGPLWLAIEGTL